jgi:regulation of enolase protein 1 (concanavalin A-like superfamily)
VTATVAGPYRIDLSWLQSTDSESAVAGYNVYVNGGLAGTTATTSYSATGLDPITNYTFTVSAFDSSPAANQSGQSAPVNATTESEPLWQSQDIGSVGAAGSFSESSGTLTIEASGADVWGVQDEFHFVYQTLNGDGEVVARVDSLVVTDAWAKTGLMMRDGLTDTAAHAMVVTTGSNGADFQYRPVAAGPTSTIGGGDQTSSAPVWLRLVREGDTFTGYKSADGVTWIEDGQATISMSSLIYVGLMATSHNDGVITTAVIDNAAVVPAVP